MKFIKPINSFTRRCYAKLKPKQLEGIGYISGESTVHFASADAARAYAKSRILQALNSKEPYERAVILRDKTAYGLFEGHERSVGGDLFHSMIKKLGCGLEVWHGHLDILPLSVSDYKVLITSPNVESVIAYNTQNKYSKFSRIEQKQYPIFNKLLSERRMQKQLESARTHIGLCIGGHTGSKIRTNNKLLEETKDPVFKLQIQELIEKQMNELANRLNVVWQMYAKNLGIKYEHNYK